MDKEDVAYIYLYNKIKEEWNNIIFSHIDRPRYYHTKWSNSDRMTNIWYYLYVKFKKYDTNKSTYKTEIDS